MEMLNLLNLTRPRQRASCAHYYLKHQVHTSSTLLVDSYTDQVEATYNMQLQLLSLS